MQNHWTERNVNLSLLVSSIEDFFRGKGFNTGKEGSLDENRIHVKPSLRKDTAIEPTMVIVKGNPNNFMVEFTKTKDDQSSIKSSLATTMFGGGFFLLNRLKSQEILEKLEKEFWGYVENAVIRLTNSELQDSTSKP